ncbi:MAG: PilX N-terminal domain-containing pilus assembly protein [Candidatus Eremiobacterota bacterium]
MRSRARQQGFVLAMTLIIIAIITIVTFMAVNVSTLESKTAMQDYNGTRAMYAARGGLAMAMSELWPNNPNWGNPPVSQTMDTNLSFTVSVTQHSNFPNPRAWRVVSTGYYGVPPQQAQRTIEAYVETEPFSRYAYFTDRERSSTGSIIRFVSNDAITGPVHSNGFFTIAGNPRFSETVTSANLGIVGIDNNTVDTDGSGPLPAKLFENFFHPQVTTNPGSVTNYNNTTLSFTSTDPKDFYRPESGSNYNSSRPTALNGSPDFSFAGGQAEIPLPTDPNYAQTNADHTFGNAPQNQTPASNFTNNPNYSGNANFAMTYDETTGTVTGFTRNGSSVSAASAPPVYKLNFLSNGTVQVFRKANNSTSFPATPFQTITNLEAETMYFDGFVVMSGVVDGRVTVGSREDVHIVGNLTYEDPDEDVMGIVAKDNIIVESRTNVNQDRTIHASMMALNGSFTVDKYNQGSPRGTLHLLGGIIQRTRGPVGTGSASSVSTGYAKDYVYDDKLASRPPLNFPDTGRVFIKAIFDKNSPGSTP